MATEKPPSLPPDTALTGGGDPPEVVPDSGSVTFTEGTESIVTTLTMKQDREINPEKYMIIHPVYFVVSNEANAAGFLSDLLFNLQSVDPMAHLLPHGDMPEETPAFASNEQIPNDASLSSFTHAYLSGLRVNSNTMLGKFWLRCHKKFTEFKLDSDFLQWLKGKTTSKRVTLDRMELSGTERYSVGFFVNVLAEQRLVENFNYQLTQSFKDSETVDVPEFQCDVFTIYNGNEPTRVYRMMANSKDNVALLQEKTSALLGKPSTNLTFISYRVWDGLNETKKAAYRGMQQQFTSNLCAIRLSGLFDTSHEINVCAPSNFTPTPQKQSIHKWITSIKSMDTTNLFHKVSTGPDGTVEMWLYKSHQKEAREWTKIALGAIAILSGIDLVTQRDEAEKMFKDPDSAWGQANDGNRDDSFPTQRDAFMEFTPPANASFTTVNNRNKQQRSRRPKKEKLILHFDMDLVKRTTQSAQSLTQKNFPPLQHQRQQQGGASVSTKPKPAGKGASTKPATVVTSLDPHAAAASAALTKAQLAMRIGQAAIAKYPPTALEKLTHGGRFYTLTDTHGHKIPVVYIANLPQPLNEETLLASREADNTSFALIPPASETTKRVSTTSLRNLTTPSQADTPIIKNTKGIPPNFTRFHNTGRITGAFKEATPKVITSAAHQKDVEHQVTTTNDAIMDDDDADDDDQTMVSANLSVGSAAYGSRLELGLQKVAAAMSPSFAAVASFPHLNEPRLLFQASSKVAQPMEWLTQKSGRGGGRMNRLSGRAQSTEAKTDPSVSDDSSWHPSAAYTGDYTTQSTQQCSTMRQQGGQVSTLANETNTDKSTENDYITLLTKMSNDHRADMARQRVENQKENEKLRDQIADLQSTITRLLTAMEKEKREALIYDTSVWDIDDQRAEAEHTKMTPQKAPMVMVMAKRSHSKQTPDKAVAKAPAPTPPSRIEEALKLVARRHTRGKPVPPI